MQGSPLIVAMLMLALGAVPGRAAEPKGLLSGLARLTLTPDAKGRFGVSVGLSGGGTFVQPSPLAISVVDVQGTETWLTDGYQTVIGLKGDLECTGTLRTAQGTQFHVTDIYHALPKSGGFTLTRDVSITSPDAADTGFNSRFALSPDTPTALTDDDVFAPGVWYKDNAHVPPTALASHLDDKFYYFREDRLPLPLVMTRDKRTGVTLTLAHLGGVPTTFAGEDGLARITDAKMQFGSLGLTNTDRPSPTFLFPGTEGERTYTTGGSRQGGRWAYRSHPVTVGLRHRYRLWIQIAQTPDFPAAVRQSWRRVYGLQDPPVLPCDLARVYQTGMNLLATYTHPYAGVISVPFATGIPDGKVNDTSSQMGFVGQALPAAALLLKYALETGRVEAVTQASAVVDFWAQNSPTRAGLPKTWYDIHPDGTFTFRSYHTFLRVASDGLDGTLRAWDVMRRHGQDKPRWLTFCRRYGDWLVGAQAADGSWAREYDFDGHPVNPVKDTTDQAIPFLVDLYKATGDAHYQQTALKAGEFCWTSVHQAYAYVGGTPDNPNVLDKEGGMMALAAFLSLHDLDGDKRWLAAAIQAADYCETWVYCWDIPMPPDDPRIIFPKGRTTNGLSLIATGHSGADNYMAAAPFLYYRLFLLTNDAHFCDVARFLLQDTKQMQDWDGTLGYADPGLLSEALSLPPPRGHGVTHWLPWLSVAILEPLVRLQETFGRMDIDQIEKMPPTDRHKRAAQYADTHGFTTP